MELFELEQRAHNSNMSIYMLVIVGNTRLTAKFHIFANYSRLQRLRPSCTQSLFGRGRAIKASLKLRLHMEFFRKTFFLNIIRTMYIYI